MCKYLGCLHAYFSNWKFCFLYSSSNSARITISSAKRIIFIISMCNLHSLYSLPEYFFKYDLSIYIWNNIRESTHPCLTPRSMGISSVIESLTFTTAVWFRYVVFISALFFIKVNVLKFTYKLYLVECLLVVDESNNILLLHSQLICRRKVSAKSEPELRIAQSFLAFPIVSYYVLFWAILSTIRLIIL